MKSARSMTGMPVIVGNSRVGMVAGVRLDAPLRTVEGIWIAGGMGKRFISRSDVKVIGEVSVLAQSPGKRMGGDERPLLLRALGADGARLGAITDAVIDGETLNVLALELSGGYVDDLREGRQRVKFYSVTERGEVIISDVEGGERR